MPRKNFQREEEPRTDDAGKPIGIASTERDITARNREAENLRRMATLVKDSNDAITIQDFEGRITAWNRGAELMYGYSEEEALALNIKLLTPPGKIEEQEDFTRRLIAGEEITSFETQRVAKDGRVIDVWMTVTKLTDDAGKPIGIASTERDITACNRLEQHTKRLLNQQTHINALSLALGQLSDLPFLYHTIYDHVCNMMDAAIFIVSFYEKDVQLIEAAFVVNEGEEMDASTLPAIPVAKEGRGRQSQVICTGKPLYLADKKASQSKADVEYTIKTGGDIIEGLATEEENIIRSVAYVPMLIAGDVIGVIQVQSHRLDAYSQEDIELLSGMANVAAIAIQNARLYVQIQNTLEGVIQTIAKATEISDPYTVGHQQRVSQLACAIAEELGLPPDRIQGIRVASLVHDIGKIAVPAAILAKPGVLTDVELSLIKTHAQVGADILKEINSPWPLDEIVIQHHERLDGSGYPRALKGEEIMVEARILAVADVVEAMASHRPYRPALGIDAALEEIREHQGKLYDSSVVEACNQLFADGFEFTSVGTDPSP